MANQTSKVVVSLDPEARQLLKRVAAASEASNKKTQVIVCNHKVKPSPHALDIVLAEIRNHIPVEEDSLQMAISEMFRHGVLFVLDPDHNDKYYIRPTPEGESSPT